MIIVLLMLLNLEQNYSAVWLPINYMRNSISLHRFINNKVRQAPYMQDLDFVHEDTPIKSQNSVWTLMVKALVWSLILKIKENLFQTGACIHSDQETTPQQGVSDPHYLNNLSWQLGCCTPGVALRPGCAEPRSLAAGQPQPPHCNTGACGQHSFSTSN